MRAAKAVEVRVRVRGVWRVAWSGEHLGASLRDAARGQLDDAEAIAMFEDGVLTVFEDLRFSY